MAHALNFDQYEVDLREGAQVDYYVTGFHWAMQKSFDERQLGGFMGLLSTILDHMRESEMPKAENIMYLKDYFIGVGLDNPEQIPISLYFFTLDQAKDIMETYLREQTECSICLRVMLEPKILRCLHTFCAECVDK